MKQSSANDLSRVEWFLHYVVLWGANQISVELDNKQITGIRFGFPGGAEGQVILNRPHRPGTLQIVRGRETPTELARALEREHLCERCHKRMAVAIFDSLFVCEPCRRAADGKLARHG